MQNAATVMHQSFVSTAPPPTGMGGDNDFHFSEPWYKPRPLCLGYICYGRRTIYLSTIFSTIFSAS